VIHYILQRLLRAIPVLLGVSVLVFSMLYFLPGDPATLMLSETSATSKEAVDRLREELGLNDPLHVQYWRFLSSALRLDMGQSIQTNREVTEMIMEVFPSTLVLTLTATAMSVLIGVPLGIAAAVRPHSWIDKLSMGLAYIAVSMPIFWLGLMLILVFSVYLGLMPITGQEGTGRLFLPAFSLAFGASSIIARLVRSNLLDVMHQEFVTTARSKGLSEQRVVISHALRNALIPTVTMVGLQFGSLLGGAVIVETVFARQGIGRMAVNAILRKDYPLVQATVLFAAAAYVLVNILVDVSYAWLDPRIKYGRT
jgi:peptide/nickel transport system permease protein